MGASKLSPEQLFAAYLGELDRDESFDLAELLRRHPGREDSLRALYDDWRRLRPLIEKAADARSVHESIARELGESVDPTVSLAESAVEHGRDASELLAELTQRASSKSRYRLEGEIARGGMGVVLKVYDGDLRRHLAMKVILGKERGGEAPVAPPRDPRRVSRFLEEAQVTGQLDHPSIVPVHELGLSSDGRVYFTMRLVRGRELSQILELTWNGQEGWNPTRTLGVLLKACEAVGYAHAKGVVHRDLKPSNVMVGRFGEVYVMDWGLARIVGSPDRHDLRLDVDPAKYSGVITDRSETPGGGSPLRTMDGDIIGTPTYMAPEQALGQLAEVGPRSDVYSIGAMLYHLLARTPPYVVSGEKATQQDVLTRLCAGPPEPLHRLAPKTPAELVSICEKAMARHASARYANVEELAEDLRAFLENRVVRAYRTGPVVELRKWIRRNRELAASMAVGFALVLGAAVSIAVLQSRANKRIKETLAEVERLNGDFVAATQKLGDSEKSLATMNTHLAKLEAERKHLFGQLGETKSERESLAGRINLLEEQYQRAQKESESLLQEREEALQAALKAKDASLVQTAGLHTGFTAVGNEFSRAGFPMTLRHDATDIVLLADDPDVGYRSRLYVSSKLVTEKQYRGLGSDDPEVGVSAETLLTDFFPKRGKGLALPTVDDWRRLSASSNPAIRSLGGSIDEWLQGDATAEIWPTRTAQGRESSQPRNSSLPVLGFRVVYRGN